VATSASRRVATVAAVRIVRVAIAITSRASAASTTINRNPTDLSVDENAGGFPPAFFFAPVL
jgi:hypothetical protein